MTYTIMASDWDRAHMEEVSAQCEKGNLMPTMVEWSPRLVRKDSPND